MNTKKIIKKLFASAIALSLTCTGLVAQADKVIHSECINEMGIGEKVNWDIEDYANNIKNIYIINYPEAIDVITEIVDNYLKDNEFVKTFEEMGSSAFLVVEEELQNMFEPNVSPMIYQSDTYYSIHSIPSIKQKSGYSDGAAAAVLMALYGCGYFDYFTDTSLKDTQQNAIINKITWDTNNKTTISEVTRTIRNYFSGTYERTYQTRYTSNFNTMLSMLTTSLEMDATPVIRIPDGENYYYGVLSSVYEYEDVQDITVIDSRTGIMCSYTFDEFDELIFPKSNSIVWMSVYAPDESEEAIANVKSQYPQGSYFSDDGKECAVHDNNCDYYGGCSCKNFDGAIQCAGFARYVFNEVKGRAYSSSIGEANVTGFGNRNINIALGRDKAFDGVNLTANTAKKYLQGLPTGAYVRVELKNSSSSYPWHSFSVLETSNTGIIVYEANVGGRCLVSINEYTWTQFANKYRLLFYVD